MKAQPWAVALGCFVAGSLAAAGIASATSAPTKIPDSTTGVITACMVKKTGAVRFINAQAGKTCNKKEKKITFNKSGPQGERGPSNGYVANRTTTVGIDALLVPTGQPKNRVVRVDPPGRFLPGQRVHQRPPLGNHHDGRSRCTLLSTTGTLSSVPVIANVNQQYYDVPLAATGSYTNTAEATVYLRCDPSGGAPLTAEGEANGATLTATRVAELTGP